MSGDQIAGQSHSMKTDNSSFERVEEFKYLGITVIDQNCIQEEINFGATLRAHILQLDDSR